MNNIIIISSLLLIIFYIIITNKKHLASKTKINLNIKTIVVIGGGLAGLIASLTIAENGHDVFLLEKESNLGGNSAKETSGINGTYTIYQQAKNIKDTVYQFEQDIINYDSNSNKSLIHTLAKHSCKAIYLLSKYGVEFNEIDMLEGHTNPRTHKVLGFEIINKLKEQLKTHKNINVILNAKFNNFILDNNIIGVIYNDNKQIYCNGVIIATGGYGYNSDMISKYRPDLVDFKWTTNGSHSMGDGIEITKQIGAKLIDMDKIEIHPTGFIDVHDVNNRQKILAPEMLRGVGGILLNKNGKRFCNELGKNNDIIHMMNTDGSKLFFIVLTETMYKRITNGKSYEDKKLMYKVNIDQLASLAKISKDTIINEIKLYNNGALLDNDRFNKKIFPNTPMKLDENYYIGIVYPVIHYCMGGIKIDSYGRVLNSLDEPIPYLFAAGEVTGGLHGDNMLGGNSLLECVVYGRISALSALKYSSNQKVYTRH